MWSACLLFSSACAFSPLSAHARHRVPVGATRTTHPFSSGAAAVADEVCILDDVTCSYSPEDIDTRFADEPLAVAGRVAEVAAALARVRFAGDDGAKAAPPVTHAARRAAARKPCRMVVSSFGAKSRPEV